MMAATNWLDLGSAFIWPIFGLLLLVLAVSPPGRRVFSPIAARIKHVKAGAFEFELNEGEATKAREDIEEAFEAYRAKIRREFDRTVHIHNLREKRGRVMERHVCPELDSEVTSNFRSTIHVPDILFADATFQLLEYYPSGGGVGRAFPVRRGILGRAWRSETHQVQGNVPTDPDELVSHWGMTIQEAAAAGQGRPSFLCAVLRDSSNSAIGIFYLDSKQVDAFGSEGSSKAEKIFGAIEKGCQESGLIGSLSQLQEEMRRKGPAVRIFDEG